MPFVRLGYASVKRRARVKSKSRCIRVAQQHMDWQHRAQLCSASDAQECGRECALPHASSWLHTPFEVSRHLTVARAESALKELEAIVGSINKASQRYSPYFPCKISDPQLTDSWSYHKYAVTVQFRSGQARSSREQASQLRIANCE